MTEDDDENFDCEECGDDTTPGNETVCGLSVCDSCAEQHDEDCEDCEDDE